MRHAIRKIIQRDNFTFTIEWNDGRIDTFRLSELQGLCPCASCATKRPDVDPDVRAANIQSVGRYAIRIEYLSGCSNGIYDFVFLRGVGKASACQID